MDSLTLGQESMAEGVDILDVVGAENARVR